jgi:hypothetical protein
MTRSFAVLFVILVAGVLGFGQSIGRSRPCDLKLEQISQIKGLRVGMTTDELFSRYPALKGELPEPDAYGYRTSYGYSPSYAQPANVFILPNEPGGGYRVTLTIFEETVRAFKIVFDRSTQRGDVSRLLQSIVTNTNLPSPSVWEDRESDRKILRCRDGNVTVGFPVVATASGVPVEWEASISVELRDLRCGYLAFAGTWRSPQFATSRLAITLGCPSSHGSYGDGQRTWDLAGQAVANRFKGTWKGESPDSQDQGSFEIFLLDSRTLHATFFNTHGVLKSSSTWVRPEKGESTSTSPHVGPNLTQRFVGTWLLSEKANITCVISNRTNRMEAIYINGETRRILSGKVSGNNFIGDWSDVGSPAKSGKFVFTLVSKTPFFQEGTDYFLVVSFSHEENEIENRFLTFQSSVQSSSDSFPELKAFDALTVTQQLKALTKKGPVLPKQYGANDLSLRAFVRGNWPVWIDYGLEINATAELTITVENAPPLIVRLEAAQRAQVKITIPSTFGSTPRIGKVSLRAFTHAGGAAMLRLYGIGMGERVLQAITRAVTNPESKTQIAHSYFATAFTRVNLRLASQPSHSQRQIFVEPTMLDSKAKIRKDIAFSFTFHSAFSNGQWEIWKEIGMDCFKVWQKRTGSISANQKKSQRWNGKIPPRKTFSVGTHAIQLMAWHGRKRDLDWVIVRSNPTIIVR